MKYGSVAAVDGFSAEEALIGNDIPSDEKDALKKPEDQDGGDDLDDIEYELTEDTFSLMYIAPYSSSSFFLSVLVLVFRLAFNAFVYIDILDPTSATNPLGIPVKVNHWVTWAQACALVIAVLMQDDLMTGIQMLYAGHSPDLTAHLPGATHFKWLLSTMSQIISSFIYLGVIFILVMQSENVIGMYLNFAALSFIGDIDEYVYKLGEDGFINDAVKSCCEEVKNTSLRRKAPRIGRVINRLFVLLAFLVLITGFGFVLNKQQTGYYACKNIFIQFSDDTSPSASLISGEFLISNEKIAGRSLTYVEEEHGSVLTICDGNNGAWTFAIKGKDPCEDYVAISEKSWEYDVTKTTGWKSSSSTPFPNFHLDCNDCSSGDKGTCPEEKGKCVDNLCICEEGFYGVNCMFSGPPCEHLTLEQTRGKDWWFPESEAGTSAFTTEFFLLKDEDESTVESYGLPVYHYDLDSTEWSGPVSEILLFLGRRWYITDTNKIVSDNSLTPYNKSTLIDFLRNEFSLDIMFEKMTTIFASDPMDYGTPSYGPSPVGLKWYPLSKKTTSKFQKVETVNPLEANFLCGICDDEINPCQNLNNCVDGKCDCGNYYGGSLCEELNDCCQTDDEENCGSCANNGTCTNHYTCDCRYSNFNGHFCTSPH